MSWRRILLIAFALAALTPGATARAEPPRPTDLHVEDRSERWRPTNLFWLAWELPEQADPEIVAVHYRVLDPLGGVLTEERLGWPASHLNRLPVGFAPGTYLVEVQLEDAAGAVGPAAVAPLRFDDVRPPPVVPREPRGWLSRAAFPYRIEIGRPVGAMPISGIQGYALSIGSSPGGTPCARTDICTDAETDLRGGIGEDSLLVPELPEGTNYVHAVAVSGSGMRSTTVGRALLRVDRTDPETHLTGLPAGWSDGPVTVVATAADDGSGMDGNGAFTAIGIDDGTPTVAAGDGVSATVLGEGVHRIVYYARDAAGNVNDGAAANSVPNGPPGVATVRIDPHPPTAFFLSSQDPTDPERIEAVVEDRLSGPSGSRGWIGVRKLGSGDRYERLPTANEPGILRARWPSESYPPGEYEFRVTGFDAAGNPAVENRRRDGGPMVLSNPLKATTSVGGGFGGDRRRRLLVPYGAGVRFTGRVTTGRSAPLGGTPVQIVERFGDGRERSEWTTSSADGTFSARIAPGPSREVTAIVPGTRTLSGSATAPAELAVRSAVLLSVSARTATIGGRPVVFSGRVGAEPRSIPAGGLAVALQFKLPGLEWAEFRTVRTDRRGRFRYAYRFADDDSRGVRFRFRAQTPAQGGWPYEPGSSKPVAVRGR